jgi:oligopeptide transport system permease protein
MSEQLSKDKFVLVQSDTVLYDDRMQTKSIGYFQDAMIRFRKNKASVVAAIILTMLILMAIVGPLFSNYELNSQNQKWANRLDLLPPKVEALSGLEFFSGHKVLENYDAYFDQYINEDYIGPEIILERYEGENAIGQIEVKVDYYAFVNYELSYNTDTSLSIEEYEAVKAHDDALLADDDPLNDVDVLLIKDAVNVNGTYKVRLKFFEFLDFYYGVGDVAFVFGSDERGQDLFTELWEGARLSLGIAFGVSLINIVIGLIIGSISGYYGGLIDIIIERVSEVLGGLPFMAILTLLLLRYGNQVWVVILAFTLTGWLGISRLARSQFYRYKGREYVLAARTLGAGDARIMYRHIFPSAVGTLITSLVLIIPGVIFSESTFSFLGIINYGESTSVGRLLANGQAVMKEHFYMVVFPAVFISLLMLSFNLFGNGLRDAFNPSLRGVEE